MANTTVQTTLLGGGKSKLVVQRVHIISDGTEESNLVVYDNSAFVNDVTKGRIDYLYCTGSDCVLRLSWDATTDVAAVSVNPHQGSSFVDFREIGGLNNPGGTGATGDLLLNTANLDSGDEVTLIIGITQS